jgi:aspartyl-tRNA(Asn)/glutamyl-tRNA(Gln) amidotransferase subunit A
VRRILKDKTNDILQKYDLIILPTSPHTAFEIGKVADPIAMYLEDIFTVQANLTGLPAISIPLFQHSNKLPFGLQLIGKSFDEELLFAFSNNLMNNFKLINT